MISIPERGIYLASRSPRRRELLSQIGVRYHLLLFRERVGEAPDVPEDSLAGEAPSAYVERMSREKAESGWRRMLQRNLPPAPVLAADTTVALDGRIFGKPVNREHAAEMLAALSGKRHEVLTAVALKNYDQVEFALSVSEVLLEAAFGGRDRAVRGKRRERRQGRRLRDPGARRALRDRAARQLLRGDGTAALRDQPAAREAA